nr:hypothetical protein [Burkholderia ambifaria]
MSVDVPATTAEVSAVHNGFIDASPANQLRPVRALGGGLADPSGMKFAIFFIYPLGIMRERPYDGGLSFSAKMQIDVEGGV